MKYNRILNILLRGISMGSKFLLFIVIAKLLTVGEVGSFGLFAAIVSFYVLFIGVDYYAYSNRELLSVSRDKYNQIICNQIYAYIPLYIISLPIVVILFYYDFIPLDYVYLFIVLATFEHIAQEQNRLLNTMQKQLSASIILFIRSGLWILIILPIMYYIESFRNIEVLLYSWLLGVITATIIATILIKKEIGMFTFVRPNIKWIKQGYKIGFLFLIGTLSFKAISTLDRFWLEYLSDISMVGIYVFYFSLIVGVTAFIHAGLIVFISPKIVKAYQNKEYIEFDKLMKRYLIELIIAISLLLFIMYFIVPFVLEWIDKEEYFKYYDVFYILMIVSFMMTIANHPHVYLYSSKQDKFILFTHISSLIVFAFSLSIFNIYNFELDGIYVVSLSILFAYIYLILTKYIGYWYFIRKDL